MQDKKYTSLAPTCALLLAQLAHVRGVFNGIVAYNKTFAYDNNGNVFTDNLRGQTVQCFDEIDQPKKYYFLSPYPYAADNPIKFIDVHGDSVWISHHTGFLGLGKKEYVLYGNGNLYNKDGTAYGGKVKGYLSKTEGAFDQINGVTSG